MSTVTRERAMEFHEALVGWTECAESGEEYGEPKSPHALTHLKAVGVVAYRWDLRKDRGSKPDADARRDAFLDYLQGCADALRPKGHGTCKTCGNPEPNPDPDLTGPICRLRTDDNGQDLYPDCLPPDFGCRYWVTKEGEAQP